MSEVVIMSRKGFLPKLTFSNQKSQNLVTQTCTNNCQLRTLNLSDVWKAI